MKLMIFVPGYTSDKTCVFDGDAYFAIYNYAIAHDFEFAYVPLPNNNFGDVGNVTLEDCLQHTLRTYDSICRKRNVSRADTIVLAGHSMGGLIVARMITDAYISRMIHRPTYVRMIHPAIQPAVGPSNMVLATVCSLVPHSVLATLPLPITISEKEMLYPGSLSGSPAIKQVLSISILSATGVLLLNNNKWGIVPNLEVRPSITIIAAEQDSVVLFKGIMSYVNLYNVKIVTIHSKYHAHFDTTVLDAIFNCIV